MAITIVSPMLPKRELEDARELAALVGIRHILVDASDIEEEVATNPKIDATTARSESSVRSGKSLEIMESP